MKNDKPENANTYFRPVQPSMKRRARFHDYSGQGAYMLTLIVEGRRPLLGRLILGDEAAENGKPAAENGKPAVGHEKQPPVLCGSVAQKPPTRHGLFEPGYNDRLLFDGEQLERWKHYLDDNPRRLAIKRQHPDLFTVKRGMRIAGHDCQTVGNHFLLDIPDKVAVIVHRRYTEKEYQWLTEQWMACGERGGVLVSAAISPKEKAVLKEARERGYNIIWLNENGFPEFYKPTGKAFDACSAGRLLQVCPWKYHTEERTISREQCLELNAMATEIAGEELKPNFVFCQSV